jgi:hypothetical protein
MLERMTYLQVPDDWFGMVTMMLAPPTRIGDVSLSHAQNKSRLLLRGFLGCTHLFPFRDEYRIAWVFCLACGEGCLSITQGSCHGIYSRLMKKKTGRMSPPGLHWRVNAYESLGDDSNI